MKEYLYYTYKCQPSSETRGKRTSTPLSEPCGITARLQTSRAITHLSRHQTKCQCGNRPRLTPANTTLHKTDLDAHKTMNDANNDILLNGGVA